MHLLVMLILQIPTLFQGITVNAENENSASKKCEVLLRIESGLLCGRIRLAENATEYYSFRGVPYGKPPLGELRFAELQPVPVWDGIRDASEEGPVCPQKDLLYGRIPFQPRGMNEDCMYLNIHVPRTAKLLTDDDRGFTGPGLPILVFIHGGGFQAGSSNSDLHGPEYFICLGDVIVITFNYRINLFGFLSLNNCQIPGNAGLRDQITLLKWVKRNAKCFGGNPEDVTIMGQSAGSTAAHLLSLSKATKGLFRRVILLSGTAIPNFFTTIPAYSKNLTNKFFEILGYSTTDAHERYCLLTTLSLTEIMAANNILQVQTGLVSFVPTLETKCENFTQVLDDCPLSLISKGRGKHLPMLIGFVENEAESFKWLMYTLDIESRVEKNPLLLLPPRISLLHPAEAPEYVERVRKYYSNGSISVENNINLTTDSFFQYPSFKTALWRSAMNAAPVYLYQFSYPSQRSMIKEGIWVTYEGAAHVEDLTYMFRTNTILRNHTSFPPKTNDEKMRAWMTNFVLNFMRCSNPTCNADESSPWPPVSTDELKYQNIAEPNVYSMQEPTAKQWSMIELLDSIDPEVRATTQFLLGDMS